MIQCTFENGNQNSLRHVVVGCILVKDGKMLLGKRSEGLLEAGKWGLFGGYAERDETTAQTVIRETLEESGWSIQNLQLLRINDNPNRPHEDRQNIDFVYFAEAVEQVAEPDWETAALRWFPLDDLPSKDEIAFDHGDSVELYCQYLQDKFALPIVGSIK